MATTTRTHRLSIMAGQHGITIYTADGSSQAGWEWRDGALRHPTGQVWRFAPAVAAAIEAAVATARPAAVERRYGHEMTAADRAEGGWEFSHVERDAFGVYTRTTPATQVSVPFVGLDVIAQEMERPTDLRRRPARR